MINRHIVLTLTILLSAATAIVCALTDQPLMLAIFKSLTTVLIIALFVISIDQFGGRFGQLVLVGLLFCLAGDVLLLEESRFVLGLSSFLIAHLLLLRAFVLICGWQWRLSPLTALLFVCGAYWWVLQPSLGDFTIPVALYTCVIAVMCWQGLGLAAALPGKDTAAIAVGAVLFVVSDSTIAWNKFVQPFELSPLLILATYWLAIYLIATGSAQLHNRLHHRN